MIQVRIIDKTHAGDINIKNQPFPIYGRMIPGLENGRWSYTIRHFETVTEMTFPDENYDFDTMSANTTFLGAYDGEKCIGLAILQDAFFKYWYLYDLKVDAAYRGKGVGKQLIDRALAIAKEKKYRGIYTIGQDNNLAACLFYLKTGFQIGGFDNRVYGGTSQEDKADVLFYRE